VSLNILFIYLPLHFDIQLMTKNIRQLGVQKCFFIF